MKFMRLFTFFFLLLGLFLIFQCCNQSIDSNTESDTDTVVNNIDQLNKLIENNPDNESYIHQRAKFYLEQKNLQKALQDIRKVLLIDSTKSEYYITLGDIYFSMGEVNACSKALDKSIDLDPNYVEGYLKHAELSYILKNYDRSISYANKALKIEPFSDNAYYIRGMTYKELEKKNMAMDDFQSAVEINAENYQAYLQLGLMMSEINNPLAVDYFNNAINIKPNSIEARYGLAMFQQSNNNAEEAEKLYLQIIDIDSFFVDAYYNLGYLNLVFSDHYNTAIDYFSKAISLQPEYPEAYYNLGYSYELSGQFEQARKYYKIATSQRENYQKAIEALNRLDEKQLN